MDNIARFIAKNAMILSLLLLVAGVWSFTQISKVQVNNAIEVWFDYGSPQYLEYQQFQSEYGSDEWLVVAFGLNSAAGEPSAQVKGVTKALRQVDERIQVLSIADADPWTRSRMGHLLLSRDRHVAGILLNFTKMGVIEDRQSLVGAVKNALVPFEKDFVFHLGGPPVLNAELDRISEEQSRLFISLAAVAGFLVLYFLFRSIFYVATIITAAGLAVGWTMGTAAGCGMTLNMISTVLPVLLWVLSLAGALHIIFHFQKEYCEGATSHEAVYRSLGAVLVPYAIASFTTGVGFLSLLLSHMEPVRNLGLWAAMGIAIGFLSNIVTIPAMLQLGEYVPYLRNTLRSRPLSLQWVSPEYIKNNRKILVFAGITALVVPLFFIPLLRAESNVLSFFKDDSRIVGDYTFIAKHLAGLSTIELDFRGDPAEVRAYVRLFWEKIKEFEGVRPVQYSADNGMRMTIFVDEMDTLAFNDIVTRVRGIIAELPSGILDTRLTGTIVLLNSIQEELVHTQVKSFSLALAVIIGILTIIFRSLKMVVIGSLANLFPVLILAGFAAVLGIPLNVATIMIASVAIGIAVDDTVFFLVRLRCEVDKEGSGDAAVDRTFNHLIGPISATTLVVASGFLVLALAEFKPVAYFGMLGGMTMILAWIGDIVLLPALLYCCHPYSRD